MAKILLVEDDNNLREIYQARLTAEGYDIVAAQNGEEALVVAKQHRPELIISDVMMPRISGFEMLDILRNTDELKATKVIMLTALGQAEDQTRAGKLGADRYLVKSQVTLEDIVNAAKDLLAGATIVEPQPVAAGQAASTPVTTAQNTTTPPLADTPQPAASTQDATAVQNDAASAPAAASADDTAASNSLVSSVPVADPDPIAPVAEPQVAPSAAEPAVSNKPQISTHTAPMLTPDETATTTDQSVGQPPTATPEPAAAPTEDEAQSLAAEEATVEAQIAQFSNGATPEPAAAPPTTPEPVAAPSIDTATPANLPDQPVAVVPEETAQPPQTENDTMLTSALEELTETSDTEPPAVLPPSQQPAPADVIPTPPTVTPENSAAVRPAENVSPTATAQATKPVNQDESEQVTVAGKKVIAPISSPEEKPDLQELLRQEETLESGKVAGSTVAPTAQNTVPDSNIPVEEDLTVLPPAPAPEATTQATETTTPPPPDAAKTSSANAPEKFDPNSIAL